MVKKSAIELIFSPRDIVHSVYPQKIFNIFLCSFVSTDSGGEYSEVTSSPLSSARVMVAIVLDIVFVRTRSNAMYLCLFYYQGQITPYGKVI